MWLGEEVAPRLWLTRFEVLDLDSDLDSDLFSCLASSLDSERELVDWPEPEPDLESDLE